MKDAIRNKERERKTFEYNFLQSGSLFQKEIEREIVRERKGEYERERQA